MYTKALKCAFTFVMVYSLKEKLEGHKWIEALKGGNTSVMWAGEELMYRKVN